MLELKVENITETIEKRTQELLQTTQPANLTPSLRTVGIIVMVMSAIATLLVVNVALTVQLTAMSLGGIGIGILLIADERKRGEAWARALAKRVAEVEQARRNDISIAYMQFSECGGRMRQGNNGERLVVFDGCEAPVHQGETLDTYVWIRVLTNLLTQLRDRNKASSA